MGIGRDDRGVELEGVQVGQRVDDPRVDDPRVDRLRVDDPRVDEPCVDHLGVDHLRVDQLRVDHLRVDDPRIDDPRIDDPCVDNPRVDNPRVDHLGVHHLRIDHLGVHHLRVDHLRVHDLRVHHLRIDHRGVLLRGQDRGHDGRERKPASSRKAPHSKDGFEQPVNETCARRLAVDGTCIELCSVAHHSSHGCHGGLVAVQGGFAYQRRQVQRDRDDSGDRYVARDNASIDELGPGLSGQRG
ncbi:MAG: hypothetical protein ACOYM9_24315, partial [Bradymonadia bacterium]